MLAIVAHREEQKFSDMFTAYVLTSIIVLANAFAFAQDYNAGLHAIQITVIGVAAATVSSQAIKIIGKACIEYWAEKERSKIQIIKERESALRGSLTEKLNELMIRFDEVSERSRIDSHRYTQETKRLTTQLESMAEELKHERIEKSRLSDQIEKLTRENERLIRDINTFKSTVTRRLEGVQNQLQITKEN